MSTIYANRPALDPAGLFTACTERGIPTDSWFGKANSFRIELGREPGRGHILLRRGDLDAIDLTKDYTLTFLDDQGQRYDLKRVTLLRAECVTPGYDGDPDAAYLCELVDRRWHLARKGGEVGEAYNQRIDGYGADADAATRKYAPASIDQGFGLPYTWAKVVNRLNGYSGAAWTLDLFNGADPTLPFAPDGTPENLDYRGRRSWDAINDALARLGCALRYDILADAFDIIRLGDATAATAKTAQAAIDRLAGAGLRTWDAGPVEPNRGKRPEKVRVLFQKAPPPTIGYALHYPVDVTLTGTAAELAGVEPGSYEVLHDDLAAEVRSYHTGQFPPTNLAALTARANERAADWLRKRLGYERRLLKEWRDFDPGAKPVLSALVGRVAFDDRGGPMRVCGRAAPDGLLEAWKAYERPFSLGPDWGGNYSPFSAGTNGGAYLYDPLLTAGGAGPATAVLGSTVTRVPGDGVYLVHAGISLVTTGGGLGDTVTAEARLVWVWADDPCNVATPVTAWAAGNWKKVVNFLVCDVVTGFTAASPPAPIYTGATTAPTEGQYVTLGQEDTTWTAFYGGNRGVLLAWQVRLTAGAAGATVRTGHAGDGRAYGGAGAWIAFRRNSYHPQPTPPRCAGSGSGSGSGISPPPPPPPPPPNCCNIPDGTTLSLTVTGGTYPGTYTGPWNAAAGTATLTRASPGAPLLGLACTGGTNFTLSNGGGLSYGTTCGPPLSILFGGSIYGSSPNLVVSGSW